MTDKNLIYDGEVYLSNLCSNDADRVFQKLKNEINWKQDNIKIAGKEIPLPRLTAWYGDKGYSYSGIVEKINDWTPYLLKFKNRLEEITNAKYNGVLLNYYRGNKDSIGWHSDDERELGNNPTIASISLGQERDFKLRHKINKDIIKIPLYSGSLLLMKGETQHNWQHCIEKSKKEMTERINLTFRYIY